MQVEQETGKNFYAEFHVFDVGQSNSQYIYYPEQNIGFLYDAGSSSKKKHIKFCYDDDVLCDCQFLKYLPKQKPLFNQLIQNSNEQSKNLNGSYKKLSDSLNTSITNEQQYAKEIVNIRKNIRDVLQQSDPKFLLVFLSHPDKDHINLFWQENDDNPSLIPDSLLTKTLVFAGGDFSYNLSQDVLNLLNFVNKKSLLTIYMYDQFRNTPEKSREFSLKFLNEKDAAIDGNLFQGTLCDMLKQFKFPDKSIKYKNVLEHLTPLNDKIFIWAINYPSNDVNAQSTVMSFKLSDTFSLICTGDAEDSTFKAINKKANINVINKNDILGTIRLIVVPHHGSINNKSQDMIDIFNPNLAIISSGNGKQYDHPNKTMIKWLEKKMNPASSQLQQIGSFSNQVVFFDSGKSLIGRFSNIISTNFSGTLFFKAGSFYRTFSDVVEIDNNEYSFNFKQSISKPKEIKELNKIVAQEKSGIDVVQSRNGQYYFKLKSGKSNKYYLLEKIE